MIIFPQHSNNSLLMHKIKTSYSLRRHSFLLVVKGLLVLLCKHSISSYLVDNTSSLQLIMFIIELLILLKGTTH